MLKSLDVSELVKRFASIALAQDAALFSDDTAKYNKLFDELVSVGEELKSRSGDQRRALTELYAHPNMQVRLAAAKETLAVAPDAARALLQSIAESGHFPQSGDAGMSLHNLKHGIFKPSWVSAFCTNAPDGSSPPSS
jgi:hypothetical protein